MMAILLAMLHRVLGLLPGLRVFECATNACDELALGRALPRTVFARREIPYEWMSMAYLLADRSAPALRRDWGAIEQAVHPIRSLLLRACLWAGRGQLSPVYASTGLPADRLRRR